MKIDYNTIYNKEIRSCFNKSLNVNNQKETLYTYSFFICDTVAKRNKYYKER